MKQTAAFALALLLLLPGAQANTLAIFRTTFGEMAVELYEDKPITVRNFARLVELGAYSEFPSIFHRVVPGFVAQGGDYIVFSQTLESTFNLFSDVANFGPIKNEYSVGNEYSNVYGTLAMARIGGITNSATSSWFFNLGNNSFLDDDYGGFTVFGRVIRGTNVLEQFNALSYTNGILNLLTYPVYDPSLVGDFDELPVTFTGDRAPNYNELIFPNIEILKIDIAAEPDGSRFLSWNSPSTMICRIEHQNPIDGTWSTLHVTNGNGQVQSMIDTNAPATHQKYRIRVE